MITILNIFQTTESKQYFVDDNGIIWLHGTLLGKRLGFSKPAEAIVMHTELDERRQVDTGKIGNLPWFVNEYGVWGMILAAKTQEAKEFKYHLKYNVLPSIRRNRVYIAPEATTQDIITAAQERGIDLALELNDQQALLAYNAQLQNRCVDFDGLTLDYLSISQMLEKAGFRLSNKLIDKSLAQIGKNVKKAYIDETGKEPKLTVKQVSSNHGTEIKSYPTDYSKRVITIATEYWDKKGIKELAQ